MISRPLLALLLATAIGVAGCQDDARTGPSTGASATTSDGAENTDPTEPTTPTAAAATGRLVDLDVFTYRLPEEVEWELENDDTFALYRDADANKYVITASAVITEGGTPPGLDESAELSLSSTTGYDPPLKRAGNRTVNGVEGWTARTIDQAFGELVYRYGTVHGGSYVDLTIIGPDKAPQTRAWIEAVLASIEWR